MATKEATAPTKKKWNRKVLCVQTGVNAAEAPVFTGVDGFFQNKKRIKEESFIFHGLCCF